MTKPHFDVIILGAGLTGSALGLVLARQGVRALLLDKAPHPRFALGESLLKPTVLWMRALAARYGVDELAVIANLNRVHSEIAPTSGVKKSFGFVRHQAGESRTTAQWWANIAVSYAEEVLEGHLFRQDTDAWLHAQAVAAGCTSMVTDTCTEIAGPDERVYLNTASGTVSAAFVVDCAGWSRSWSRAGALFETPSRLATNSRSLYTHMIGVRPFDDCAAAPAPALPWHQGTLHHILDGAWVWVIPFDNHPRSRNRLVSVGLNLDNRLHPAGNLSPAQEWQAALARYPALHAQFRDAQPVRPWVATGRLQVSAPRVVGERIALLGQAAGNVDALFSRGLLNAFQCLYLLADLLLGALREDDFASARFAPLERLHANLLAVHDGLVHGSYIGFRTTDLTHPWLALWSYVEQLSLAQVVPTLSALERDDQPALARARATLDVGDCIVGQAAVLETLAGANAVMDAFALNEIDGHRTMEALSALTAPLAARGFDQTRFVQLTTQQVFSKTARRLLSVEHTLTAAIEIIDRHADFPVTLRSAVFVNALVRLLALRAARTEEVLLQDDELARLLRASIAQVGLPNMEMSLLEALTAGVDELRMSATNHSATYFASESPRVLFDCCADGRAVRLRYEILPTPGEPVRATLELRTEFAGDCLTVSLSGTPPSALLSAEFTNRAATHHGNKDHALAT